MPYSKRWKLVHLLGGKCVECGEENFGLLEIDHKFNDGDLERTYYTKTESRYLNNPMRAKQRLQILCKTCHENKHHNLNHVSIPKPTKLQTFKHRFMEMVKNLEGGEGTPFSEDVVVSELCKEGFSPWEARLFFRRMLNESSIYESSIGRFNRV